MKSSITQILQRSIPALIALALFSAPVTHAQPYPETSVDPFQRIVPTIVLSHQTMFEAFAKLYAATGIVVSVERVLAPANRIDATDVLDDRTDPRFTATIASGDATKVLDEICALDGRYAWSRDGNMANVYPWATVSNPDYLFNRRIPIFQLTGQKNPGTAAVDAVAGLPGAGAQSVPPLVVVGVGAFDFAQPWTIAFRDITVRQAINRIAQHLCTTCGWQLVGTKEPPTLMFYRRLKP